jgi:ppGpp synthetase/RelA/SpoT-type nucleotidyltranferase
MGRMYVDFPWQNFNHLKLFIKEITLSMQFRVLYVVLWAKIAHSPNYKQWKRAKNPVSWWSIKIVATKKNFT